MTCDHLRVQVPQERASRTRLSLLAVLPVPIALATGMVGCEAGSSEGGAVGVTMRDSAGIRIVENHTPALPNGRFWTLDREPEFVLGGRNAAGSPEPAGDRDDRDGRIWQVKGLARLVDGRIAVLSQGNHRVFLFEPSGKLSKALGGRGNGPGEFVRPERLQYLPPDTLVVWDYWMGPVTYLDTAGAVLGRRSIDLGRVLGAVPGASEESPMIPLPDGSAIVGIERGDPGFQRPRDGTVVRHPQLEFVRMDLETYVPQSLGTWDGLEMWAIPREVRTLSPLFAGWNEDLMPIDLMVKSHIAVGRRPRAVYVADGDANLIWQFSLDGKLLRSIRRSTGPVPVTAMADRARRDRLLPLMGENPQWSEAIQAWPRREHHPAIAGLVVDAEGHLWVREWSSSESGMPDQWSVFDPEGRWQGIVDGFPDPWICYRWPRALPCWVDRDWFLMVTRDETGVETIQAHRIRRHVRDR